MTKSLSSVLPTDCFTSLIYYLSNALAFPEEAWGTSLECTQNVWDDEVLVINFYLFALLVKKKNDFQVMLSQEQGGKLLQSFIGEHKGCFAKT